MINFVLFLTVWFAIPAWTQPHDFAWTFGNVGSSSYRLDAFNPTDIEFGEIGTQDPTLPLELGKRYQIKVTNYTVHPFEIIAKSSSPSQDIVLLSMAIQGPFESDPDVAWQDDNRGTVSFTVTTALYQAMSEDGRMPGYRCRPHLFQMRGDFTAAGLPIDERIAPFPVGIELEVVASGLTAPVSLEPDPLDSDRLYILDQSGLVRVIDHGQLLEEPLLDVQDLLIQPLGFLGSFDVNDFDERGLLGLAFHPKYAKPASPGYLRLYTYTSEPAQETADFTIDIPLDQVNHQSVIREWQLNPNNGNVDPDSSRVLMRIDQPQFNHNAGHLAFGPKGYLYIALGDGGGANDTADGHGTEGNGQNINTVHGSILRIDPTDPALTPFSTDLLSVNGAYRVPVDNPFVDKDGIDEIYAYGLRNPYRFSFDKRSGALIVADVGQGNVEEINIVQKGGNYGWHLKEGSFMFDPEGVEVGLPLDDPALLDPVAEYDHDDGLSIIGGFTYYGITIPELWVKYVFGDFSRGFFSPDGRILVADLFTSQIHELLIGPEQLPLGLFVKGIGQDHQGEVYVLASKALGPYGDTGVVLKIVPLHMNFDAELSGNAAGTDSMATGLASFDPNPDGSSISYRLEVKGIQNVTMAHIHIATEPGGDGLPAVWLYPDAPPATLIPGEFSRLLAKGQITADNLGGPLEGLTLSDLLIAISENRAYVNVHTEQFPAGAIRGAVEAVYTAPPFTVELSGNAAVTDSKAIEQAILKLDSEAQSVSYQLKVLDIENVTMAHIHIASDPGGDGLPAVWLYPSAPPAQLIPGEFSGILGEGLFTTADFVGPLGGGTLDDLIAAIKDNRAYVNIHTEQFPAGEIRGQLK
ncbi:CHRD domain-containing protein [Planctomycetota bacterium]